MSHAASDISRRTPEEVFQHHVQALGAEDVAAIVTDYTETAHIISPEGVVQGKAAIGDYFTDLIRTVPRAQWSVKTTFVDNILFLEWTADSDRARVSDGVDTFIFENGLIQTQTVRFTAVPKS
ncbi:MAG TPA: nuclear transport factor 2 family protein [Ktedonobacterales bacterium]|nr:nuclear transport factor 2 family protein [Ktedonobacterales bacterium]